MKNIILTGMMGAGKTSCGRMLAELTNRRFIDTDACISEREGRSVGEIFTLRGEEYFRNLELELTRELSSLSDCVIASGGGLILNSECCENLKQNGIVVFLNRDIGEILETLESESRPLASGGREAFIELYRKRLPVYEKAADIIIVPGTTVEESVNSIIGEL